MESLLGRNATLGLLLVFGLQVNATLDGIVGSHDIAGGSVFIQHDIFSNVEGVYGPVVFREFCILRTLLPSVLLHLSHLFFPSLSAPPKAPNGRWLVFVAVFVWI